MRSTIKSICLPALLLLAFFAPAFAQAQNVTLHHVAAGVSKYSATSKQTDLVVAHKDADDVANFWRQHGPKMFAKVNGDALLNDKATRKNVLARIDQVAETAKPGDWAVIYLAGHGGPYPGKGGKDWAFCAHDDRVLGSELQVRIAKLADNKVTVVLILDCCFSGMMATPDTKAVVMAACRGDELSSEPPVLRNGRFTAALLTGLRGQADVKNEGRVTLAGLGGYVTQQVARFSDNQQTPLFRIPEGMQDDLPVVVKSAPRNSKPTMAPQLAPTRLTPESVAALLRTRDHQAAVQPKNGEQGKTVSAVIEEDGWRYEVSIRFTTDENGMWFSTTLRPADGLSPRQMQSLMKKSSELACMDVFTIDAAGRLCLETPNTRIAAVPYFSADEVFLQKLNRHLRTIRDSHDQWKVPSATSLAK